jgi:hypothetical protein
MVLEMAEAVIMSVVDADYTLNETRFRVTRLGIRARGFALLFLCILCVYRRASGFRD